MSGVALKVSSGGKRVIIPAVQTQIRSLLDHGGDTLGLLPPEPRRVQSSEGSRAAGQFDDLIGGSSVAGQFDDSMEDTGGDQFEDAEEEPPSFLAAESLSKATPSERLTNENDGPLCNVQYETQSRSQDSSLAGCKIPNSKVATNPKCTGAISGYREKLNSIDNSAANSSRRKHNSRSPQRDGEFCDDSSPHPVQAKESSAALNSNTQVSHLSSNDVVFGESPSSPRPGNVFFRRLVRVKQKMYYGATTCKEKRAIVRFIFDVITGLSPPGKFLKPIQNYGWEELNPLRALHMISKALINGVVDIQIIPLKGTENISPVEPLQKKQKIQSYVDENDKTVQATESGPGGELSIISRVAAQPPPVVRKIGTDGDENDKKIQSAKSAWRLQCSVYPGAELLGINSHHAVQTPTKFPTLVASSSNPFFPTAYHFADAPLTGATPGKIDRKERISAPPTFPSPMAHTSEAAYDPSTQLTAGRIPSSLESQPNQKLPHFSDGEFSSRREKALFLRGLSQQSMYAPTISTEDEFNGNVFVSADSGETLFFAQGDSALAGLNPLYHRIVETDEMFGTA